MLTHDTTAPMMKVELGWWEATALEVGLLRW